LVGNYEFNDESLDNSGSNSQAESEIPLPLDDDYYGVRRSLWISTDAIYKSAARQFQQNKNTVSEEKDKTLKDIPHRSFVKMPPTKIIHEVPYKAFDKTLLENYAREISAIFKKYPEIVNSSVILSSLQGKRYLENSEGTSIKTGMKITFLQVSCQSKTEKGEMIFDQFNKFASSVEGLPHLDSIKNEVDLFAKNFIQLRKEEAIIEEYTGPVLFMGDAVASLFQHTLLSNTEGLYASNIVEDQSKGIRYEGTNILETKLGKPVLPESYTVECLPKLKEYLGQPVLGSFDADDEGIVPANELKVIEKGILKHLFHDRTSVKQGQIPNGFGDGPGVLRVSYDGGTTIKQLKQKLIDKAKAEGLDYAFIVKESQSKGAGFITVYKVSVKSGVETILRSALLEEITLKELKKTLGASKEAYVRHIQTNSMGGPGVMTIIAPEALLLEEVEIKPTNSYFEKEEEIVKSPLLE
jgi:hypothetical protein